MIKSFLIALAVLFAVSGPAFASIVGLSDQNVVFQEEEGQPAPEEPSTEGGGGGEEGGGGD